MGSSFCKMRPQISWWDGLRWKLGFKVQGSSDHAWRILELLGVGRDHDGGLGV